MGEYLLVNLIFTGVLFSVMFVVLRRAHGQHIRTHVTGFSVLALILFSNAVTYLPLQTVEQLPGGRLVAVQLSTGFGSRVLVETDTAFYTARGAFTARKGEQLKLLVKEHPIFGSTKRHLCSTEGCTELTG